MDTDRVSSSCPDDLFTGPLQDWVVDPDCLRPKLDDSESEDVLQGVDPNEVFPSAPRTDASSGSDGGVSDGPVSMVTSATTATVHPTPATIYQVVYDISVLGGAEVAPGQENVISVELGGWSSPVPLSDSCVVSELPELPAAPTAAAGDLLRLTDEEQRLLDQEGVSLPGNLPLTKAEDRILRKVRRKIRNKQSAQDSRRRRREYIDGLESRAASCSVQNSELQRTVEQLEKHNRSLLAQLRQLQSLIKQSVSKGAQTSTCFLIIFVSLALIILPTFSPFGRRSTSDDDLRPTGVISRNILTDPGDLDGPAIQLDPSAPSSQLSLSGAPEGGAVLRDPTENQEAVNGTTREESQSESGVAAVSGATDSTKPAHADEM